MKATLLTFLFIISFLASFPQVNLNSGLVAYYPFNGNANDESGNGNNAIFNNATLTTDRSGNANSAYYFNGVDNYIQIPNAPSLNPSNQISISVMVKPEGFYYGPCHGNRIIMKGDADYLTGNYLLTYDDNFYSGGQNCFTQIPDTLHEMFYSVSTGTPLNNPPFVQKDTWHRLVYTYDGSNAKLYIDCNLVFNNAVSGLTFSNQYDLFLGKMNHPQFPYWFNGVMDEVRIYNRALNEEEVNVLCAANSPAESCNTWLSTPSNPSYVRVGQLNVAGNQITVEATINRTVPYSGGTLYAGDIVSKHDSPSDANYLLRPNEAEITTTNGYFRTPDICEIELNKTYHVAMVYDGSTLKFYRNGFLMSQGGGNGKFISKFVGNKNWLL